MMEFNKTTIKTSIKFSEWVGTLKKKLRRASKTDVCDDMMRVIKAHKMEEELR